MSAKGSSAKIDGLDKITGRAMFTDDMTRPKTRFRRILEPTLIGVFSPFYVMLLVASFIQFAGPYITGTN